MAVTTAAKVKAFMDTEEDRWDTLIATLITNCQSIIEDYCNRILDAADYTEYHDGGGVDFFIVKNPPINTITSVHDSSDRTYGAGDLVSTDDYVSYANEGIVQLDGGVFLDELKNIKIIYNGGYSSIPGAIEQAATEMVAKKLREGTKGEYGMVSRSFPDGSVAFTQDDLLPSVKRILNQYRLRPYG